MKIRLDKLLLEKNLAPSRQKAQAMIAAGQVMVNNRLADKSGTLVEDSVTIAVKQSCRYVSRGGYKLEAGLEYFRIKPEGLVCLDIGASTGGFSDCLLKNGAAKIYAVDVGYGQLAWELRQDPRLVVMERTNARYLTAENFADLIDLAVIDASFISLKLLIPPLLPLFRKQVSILALIKPQFEVGRGKVGKRGVVLDPALHQEVIDEIVAFCKTLGLQSHGVTPSPILGPKGNKEFLIHLVSDPGSAGTN
ncbi:MAG: TlyA family RNA methyltransferase [Desulfobulbaceae bacterium]|jgi:23S rRNA (cytidine1920-2'-O)/16S rRNA (cytidine1409-2'-O)-methyltransferase|nr:TlyA family RNA methyltransferase [Desulfobulbaceae bacterium]HKJ13568.1 TlyA family RNA methyltransferase [Desulfobulbales bacterium]MDH3775892.1 TlyA family RNA methyltransferase [Desulfobulbaceae bacterium]MDH3865515.1 TlyA family RNA methyltransferase [Desulfobulbaceae bacterium]MDH3995955.1 TlyA family RNA methyltransferase [Desulfobulbaceae bacterium]